MAYTLQEYYDGPADTPVAITSSTRGCQTFTPAGTFTISAVSINCYQSASGTAGIMEVGVYATSAGKPTGSALCSATFDGDTLTTDSGGEWKFITFASPVELTASTVYALVMFKTETTDGTVYWRCDTTSPTYAGGSWVRSTTSGVSWTIYTATETLFRTYSGTPDAVYIDAECTIACTSSLTITAEVLEYIDAEITIACTSTITISAIANVKPISTLSRLFAAGSNAVYYEDI